MKFIAIQLPFTFPESRCCLFRRDIPLRLCHQLVSAEASERLTMTWESYTYPTRNFLTVALLNKGG